MYFKDIKDQCFLGSIFHILTFRQPNIKSAENKSTECICQTATCDHCAETTLISFSWGKARKV